MNREVVGTGRYVIERTLGRGGMGTVFAALDRATGRRVALKRLHQRNDARQAALFEREYRTLAGLRHPHIVQVFEYGVDALGPYYTMELLEGSDLSARTPLGWRDVCTCLRDTAAILGVLHARRLIHRDLSPRNLWRMSNGHIKLLDFGALAGFGVCDDLVGTPAFIAPEALAGRPLDQRTDLYGLGALGYWLLTGAHAYNATQLNELHTLWQHAPVSVGTRARLLHGDAHEIPGALEQLIAALLRQDPDERPQRAADVVDQLNGLAGLSPEPEQVTVRGYLDSTLFVGREHERQLLVRQLQVAASGLVSAVWIEAERGYGRSRLLAELSLDARTQGAVVVQARALENERPYALAIELVNGLLAALPSAAEQAARPYASVLGTMSSALRERLGQPALPVPLDSGAERMRKQVALSELCLSLARQHTLALLVDDLQDADEASQALLSALARADAGCRLLLVATGRSGADVQLTAAAQSYRSVACCTRLPALMPAEVHALMRSVFGETMYLERYAARVHSSAGGAPAQCMQLVSELVNAGVARYADGSWSLPAEVPDPLPSPAGGELASLAQLPALARRLAGTLSLAEHGAFPRELLPELVPADEVALRAALHQLQERRIVREDSDGGLRITSSAVRSSLAPQLDSTLSRRVHRALSAQLSAAGDILSCARAALHDLYAGDQRRAAAELLGVCRRIMAGEHETLHACARILESALRLLPEERAYADVRLLVLCSLAVAGYVVDRRYATRWGDAAVHALWQALRFAVAVRLRPVVGGKAALGAALASAAARLALRRSRLRLFELIAYWVAVLGYLMGPATLSLDARRLRNYASLLEPLLALGPDHGVTAAHRFALGLAAAIEDRLSEAHALQASVIERLSRPGKVPGMSDANRRNLLSAALYNAAIRYSWACDPRTLEIADQLANTSPVNDIQADHLRALYFGHHGDLDAAEQVRARVELAAIRLGTAWQAELLSARHELRLSMFTRDLAISKRALRTLSRLTTEIPSLSFCERRARALDALLRGRYLQTVALLEPDEPAAVSGPIFMRALLADAYNSLGRHADAKRVCLDELARFTELDRSFVIANLPLELELARAEAGLAEHTKAAERLDGLLAQHHARGALVTGRLHEARARLAIQCGELDLAARHCSAMEAQFRTTRIASLLTQARSLRQALEQARGGELSPIEPRPAQQTDVELLSRIDALLREPVADPMQRARACLQAAVERVEGESGFILRAEDSEAFAWFGAAPQRSALAWARSRLDALAAPDEQTVAVSLRPQHARLDRQRLDGVEHQLTMIWSQYQSLDHPVAALVIRAGGTQPDTQAPSILRAIGERLIRISS